MEVEVCLDHLGLVEAMWDFLTALWTVRRRSAPLEYALPVAIV